MTTETADAVYLVGLTGFLMLGLNSAVVCPLPAPVGLLMTLGFVTLFCFDAREVFT